MKDHPAADLIPRAPKNLLRDYLSRIHDVRSFGFDLVAAAKTTDPKLRAALIASLRDPAREAALRNGANAMLELAQRLADQEA